MCINSQSILTELVKMLAEANNEYSTINESNTNMGQSERKKPLLEKQKNGKSKFGDAYRNKDLNI